MLLLDYGFEFVDNIWPVLDRCGKIKEFYPQDKYENKRNIGLNPYGAGGFCRFSIHPKWSSVSGVYAFFADGKLAYIGQCLDFAKRINQGYGSISPRNCYRGGQPTNCKINKMVLNACRQGGEVKLYFFKTYDFDRVERELIRELNPPYNTALSLGKKTDNTPYRIKTDEDEKSGGEILKKKSPDKKVGVTEVKKYIGGIFDEARQKGKTSITLVSGEIHRELGLNKRMPSVCSAMYSMMGEQDTVIHSTPSGLSSTIEITYIL
jgi:hypothetical protein